LDITFNSVFLFFGNMLNAELALVMIGFHLFINIFPFLIGDIFDIIFNLLLVILFSILSGWIPFSVKSFLFCIILYSLVLPMIFSNLTYWVHSSTFSGFVDFILISFFILVILFLFLFIIKSSTWEHSSFFKIFEIILNLVLTISLSGGSYWISSSTNLGLFLIILISSFLLIIFLILEYWELSSTFFGFEFIIFIFALVFDIIGFHFFGIFSFVGFDIIFNLDLVILLSIVLYWIPFSIDLGFVFIIFILFFIPFSIFVCHWPICEPNSSFLIFDIICNLSLDIIMFSFLGLLLLALNYTDLFSTINNLLNDFFFFCFGFKFF